MEVLAIAKFKIHQCILLTVLPNLMLAKVSHYAVVYCILLHVHVCTATGVEVARPFLNGVEPFLND